MRTGNAGLTYGGAGPVAEPAPGASASHHEGSPRGERVRARRGGRADRPRHHQEDHPRSRFLLDPREDVERLVPVLESALLRGGVSVSIKRHHPGFARLLVSDESDVTVVDLGYDFRLDPPMRTPVGTVASQDELGADKMLALFGRAEARQFVDVYLLFRTHFVRATLRAGDGQRSRLLAPEARRSP